MEELQDCWTWMGQLGDLGGWRRHGQCSLLQGGEPWLVAGKGQILASWEAADSLPLAAV